MSIRSIVRQRAGLGKMSIDIVTRSVDVALRLSLLEAKEAALCSQAVRLPSGCGEHCSCPIHLREASS